MGHKGHWGEYTGNAKWSRDHAHTRVTSKNYDDAVKDDAAHIDYLKRDINYDAKHGHNDENMTADEKHISKLAGDMKYDKKHHSPAHGRGGRMDHDMGNEGWKAHKKTMHGIRDHGGPNMSAFHAHGDEFRAKAKAASKGEQGDYDYDDPKVVALLEKAKAADAEHNKEKEEKRDAAPQRHCMGDK